MQLRPMTMADADKMLQWKNDEVTRRFAIQTHELIEKDAHYKYLEENLQYFQVIEGSNNSIGAVRIKEGEISIWIDRTFRGQGIATYVLEKISEEGMTAKIVNINIASLRAFINAGFKPISYEDNYYTFKK